MIHEEIAANSTEPDYEEFTRIIDGFDLGEYENRLKFLKRLFRFYQSNRQTKPRSSAVQYAERLIQLDAKYIQQNQMNKWKDSHNAFVLYYVGRMSPRAIANKMNRTPRSVLEIIAYTRKRMMKYVFGIDGLKREMVDADLIHTADGALEEKGTVTGGTL